MRKLIAPAIFMIAASLSAQPIEIKLRVAPVDTPTRKADTKFQLAGTFGFSVDQALGNYYLFQSINYQRKAWNAAGTDMYDLVFPAWPGYSGPPPCDQSKSPYPVQDVRCGDAAGVVWKQPTSAVTRWNYFNKDTGTTGFLGQSPTFSTWPRVWSTPDPPEEYPMTGAPGYATTLDAAKVNLAIGMGELPLSVPPSGCTRDDANPNYYATSAANTKVVYANGKWYMAFNEAINNPTITVTNKPPNPPTTTVSWSSKDLFRVGWATSTDGRNWTVRHILFRTALETKYCGGGLLLTQLFVDNGNFYMLLNELGNDSVNSDSRVLLLSARIDTKITNEDGYETWQIAANHPTDPNHYDWVNTPPGGLLNTAATGSAPLNAYTLMPSNEYVKQAAIARVFNSSAAGSPSRFVGIVVDASGLKLWSAPNLDTPFSPESSVDTTYIKPKGEFGWEFGFTQHPDNSSATPRLVGTELDFWLNADLWQSGQNPDGHLRHTTLYRTTATLSGGIFSPRGSFRTASGLHYVSAAANNSIHAMTTSNGLNEHWVIRDANGGSLVTGDTVYLMARNGLYVTNNGGSILAATKTSPSTYETFVIEKKNGGGTIVNGDLIALRSTATTKYIIAAGGGGTTVTNNGLDANPYTRFVYLAN